VCVICEEGWERRIASIGTNIGENKGWNNGNVKPENNPVVRTFATLHSLGHSKIRIVWLWIERLFLCVYISLIIQQQT